MYVCLMITAYRSLRHLSCKMSCKLLIFQEKEVIIMKELLETIVSELVEDKSAIVITEDAPDEEGVITFHLHVAEPDMGRVIGKQGRIAKAIRTVMRASASRQDQKIMVEID